MADVVKLGIVAKPKFEPVGAVVDRLTHMLTLARLGKLRGIAVAMVKFNEPDSERNGRPGWGWATSFAMDSNPATVDIMSSALTVLQADFVKNELLSCLVDTTLAEEVQEARDASDGGPESEFEPATGHESPEN